MHGHTNIKKATMNLSCSIEHATARCCSHTNFGVYVLGVGLLHFARCGSASVLCSFVQIWEIATTRKYLCKWHRFCSFFDEQSPDRQTDIHTRRVLTAIHTINYCKIQTAQRVGGGCAVVSTVCVRSLTIQSHSFSYLYSVLIVSWNSSFKSLANKPVGIFVVRHHMDSANETKSVNTYVWQCINNNMWRRTMLRHIYIFSSWV